MNKEQDQTTIKYSFERLHIILNNFKQSGTLKKEHWEHLELMYKLHNVCIYDYLLNKVYIVCTQ